MIIDGTDFAPYKYHTKGKNKGLPNEMSKLAFEKKLKPATCECTPGDPRMLPVAAVQATFAAPRHDDLLPGQDLPELPTLKLDIKAGVDYAASQQCQACNNPMIYSASLHMICCGQVQCQRHRKFQSIPASAHIPDPIIQRVPKKPLVDIPPDRHFCPQCSQEMQKSMVLKNGVLCNNAMCKGYLKVKDIKDLHKPDDRKCAGCEGPLTEVRINGMRSWYCGNKECKRCIHHPIKGDDTDVLPAD
jgi:hypothetical protein